MRTIIRSTVYLIALGSFSLAARAGVVFQQEGGEVGAGKPKQAMTISIDSGKIRVDGDDSSRGKYAIIFDSNKQVLWMLSPGEGTYREMTGAEIEGMGQQMSQAMQRMQEQLATVPPEQRAMVEQMMKKQMGGMPGGGAAAAPTITVEEKGSEKVGQFNTTHYAVSTNGQLSQEIWAASNDQVHIDEADLKTFQALSKFFEPLSRNAPKGSWSAPTMQQIKGMPVRTLVYEGARPATEWNVIKVEQRSVAGSQFTLPSGMKKAPPMGMPMGMGK